MVNIAFYSTVGYIQKIFLLFATAKSLIKTNVFYEETRIQGL